VQNSWTSVLVLSLFATIVRSILIFIPRNFEVSSANQFLLQCSSLFVDSWLFVCAATLAANHLRGETVSLRAVVVRAFVLLPKTFLSYLVSGGLLVLSLLFPLALPLGVLFVWAPFFVAGELFVHEERPPSDPDSGGYEPEEDDEPRLFVRKSVADLGLARAVRFGFKNYPFTLQALILPLAVYLFSMAVTHFFFASLEIAEMGILSTFVSTVLWTALTLSLYQAFLLSQPRENLSLELQIDTRNHSALPVRNWVGDLFSDWLPLLLLTGIAAASSWYLFEQYKMKVPPFETMQAAPHG
jgi:hypothetical protein